MSAVSQPSQQAAHGKHCLPVITWPPDRRIFLSIFRIGSEVSPKFTRSNKPAQIKFPG
jgi:hypothetical protein